MSEQGLLCTAERMNNHRDIAKPELVHKLEGCTDEVNGAVLIPGKLLSIGARWKCCVMMCCRREWCDQYQQ